MPEIQEVFRMATQKVRPDPEALERQHRDQRRRAVQKRAAVYAVVALLLVAGVVIGISTLGNDDVQPAGSGSNPSAVPTPTATLLPSGGSLEPGTYVVSAIDPEFDASYQITVTVPNGYSAYAGWAILGASDYAMSAQIVGNVYADPCHWEFTLLDPPVGQDFDALVAAFANQRMRHASKPTDVIVDGFAGKQVELTVPAGINVAECDGGQFRSFVDTGGGEIYHSAGVHELMWIVDVEGTPLVIEVAFPSGASAFNRSELLQMVDSVRIDPR